MLEEDIASLVGPSPALHTRKFSLILQSAKSFLGAPAAIVQFLCRAVIAKEARDGSAQMSVSTLSAREGACNRKQLEAC